RASEHDRVAGGRVGPEVEAHAHGGALGRRLRTQQLVRCGDLEISFHAEPGANACLRGPGVFPGQNDPQAFRFDPDLLAGAAVLEKLLVELAAPEVLAEVQRLFAGVLAAGLGLDSRRLEARAAGQPEGEPQPQTDQATGSEDETKREWSPAL